MKASGVGRRSARTTSRIVPPGFDPRAVDGDYYVVYHGTTGYPDSFDVTTQMGLGWYGRGHSRWELEHGTNPTVTTNREYALTYTEGSFGPQQGILLTYRIPLSRLREYLWPSQQNEGWRPDRKVYAHALRKYLPQAWLRDITALGKT